MASRLVEDKSEPKSRGEQKRDLRQEDRDVIRHHKFLIAIAAVAILLQGGMLFLALFDPGLPYIVSKTTSENPMSQEFVQTLVALTNAQYANQTKLDVLTNGSTYYPAELDAIRSAQKSITLEAYIFVPGEVGKQFLDALAERARAGVKVRMVTDAIGSSKLHNDDLKPLKDAGGQHYWYMPLRWYSWPHANNRTHRELLIVDGKIGFIGGSGWADHWWKPEKKDKQPWRDTMIRVEGPAVTGLQSVFSENWLEASGQMLMGKEFFPFEPGAGDSAALVVRSSPTTGRSTPARVLVQTLIASARHRIYITTPYFLPDKSIRDELAKAIRERAVEVRILTPGPGTDHLLTRRSSRRLFGDLLQAGAHIYEYQPAMIHAKVLMVDSQWAAVGSTNIDPRSFKLNDEDNLATNDARFTQRLEQDFYHDLGSAREVRYEEWRHRPITERIHELFGGLVQAEQ